MFFRNKQESEVLPPTGHNVDSMFTLFFFFFLIILILALMSFLQVKYCSSECRQAAADQYHRVLCLGPSQEDPDHPVNKLQDAWRWLILPPFCVFCGRSKCWLTFWCVLSGVCITPRRPPALCSWPKWWLWSNRSVSAGSKYNNNYWFHFYCTCYKYKTYIDIFLLTPQVSGQIFLISTFQM